MNEELRPMTDKLTVPVLPTLITKGFWEESGVEGGQGGGTSDGG